MDLLRVLAMLMIVFNHLVYHGVQHVPAASAGAMSQMSVHAVQANFLALQFLAYASLVATNIFFLITGYFLVKPREISYAVGKSFKLWRVISSIRSPSMQGCVHWDFWTSPGRRPLGN